MWEIYDRLIAGTPETERIAWVGQGKNWTVVQTESGLSGAAALHPARSGRKIMPERFLGMTLREAAAFVKSWDFEEACAGQAAINAGMNHGTFREETGEPDAFLRYRDPAAGKKVAVIGHFAYLEKRLAPICNLCVLERKPRETDYPDPACEYLLPEMDLVFITGCTLANKTLPRLLQLSQHAYTVLSGPSTTLSPVLFEAGADALCGFIITDPEKARLAAEDRGSIFDAGRMVCLEKPKISEKQSESPLVGPEADDKTMHHN